MNDNHYLIPEHTEGTETDIVQSITTDTVEDAEDYFVDAKNRLLDVAKWGQYAALPTVSFELADSHRHRVNRPARRGDHIVISKLGEQPVDSYDWLTIDAIEYDDYPDDNVETFAIRLHVTASVTDNATATIVIARRGKTLSAIYHGRNNATDEPDVWHGLDALQWGTLMKGFLEV